MGERLRQFVFAGSRQHRRQTGEHVAKVDPGVVAVALAGDQQAEMDRRRSAATVVAKEKPVAASNAEAANGVLALVVVDIQPAVLG